MNTKIYELTELIDKNLADTNVTELSENERNSLADKIKPLLSKDSIVLAQVNPICGNVKYNTLKAKKWIDWAELIGVKAIVFPETFLMGIPFGDYLVRFPIVVEECREWLEALAKITGKTKVIIGFVE